MKSEIELIWDSLYADGCGKDKVFLLRRLHSLGLHIGIDIARNQKILLMEIEDNFKLNDLPEWHGVALDKICLSSEKEALILRLVDNKNIDIFNALIKDFDLSLADAETLDQAISLFIECLYKWQIFFEKYGNCGLGEKAQRGLLGELYFLKQYILPSLNSIESIQSWKGHSGGYQDFSFPGGNVEIKTTLKKEPVTFIISSEKQLDDKGLDALYLFCLLLTVSESKGYNLPDIIKEIRENISCSGSSLRLFNDYLEQAGYIDEQEKYYCDKFYIIHEEHLYKVNENFPRIIKLPEGVGDIKYSVLLASCKNFEVDINSEIIKLCRRNKQ